MRTWCLCNKKFIVCNWYDNNDDNDSIDDWNLNFSERVINGQKAELLDISRQHRVLQVKLLDGSHSIVLLPRIKFTPQIGRNGVKFARVQFPVRLAYACTINIQNLTYFKENIHLNFIQRLIYNRTRSLASSSTLSDFTVIKLYHAGTEKTFINDLF